MHLFTRIAAAAALAASAPAVAVTVPSNQRTDTIVGNVVAGQSYTIAISGFSTLCSSCNGGGALTFDSNGKPIATPQGAYAGFGQNGLNEDPSTPQLDYGIAGSNFNLGALVFIFANGNTALGSPFSLQNGQTFNANVTGTLNAIVNDTVFTDNPSSGFAVSLSQVSPGPVPEPATWAMMLLGFGMIGGVARRRRLTSRIRTA